MARCKIITSTGVRRRVFVLGIISGLVALIQIIGHLVMLSLVLKPHYFDGQVASLNIGMVVLTACYLGLTGRLLFLLIEKRYEELKTPEWCWWFCTLAVITFNILQVVWFALIPDPAPAVVNGVAVFIYLTFFKFAKDDLKFLREDAALKPTLMTRHTTTTTTTSAFITTTAAHYSFTHLPAPISVTN